MGDYNKLEAALWFLGTDFSGNLMQCIAERPAVAAQEGLRKKALAKSAFAINSAVSGVTNGSVYIRMLAYKYLVELHMRTTKDFCISYKMYRKDNHEPSKKNARKASKMCRTFMRRLVTNVMSAWDVREELDTLLERCWEIL